MPREVKHGRHAFLEEAAPSAQGTSPEPGLGQLASAPSTSSTASTVPLAPVARAAVTPRWFAALGPAGEPPPVEEPTGRGSSVAAPLVLAALVLTAAVVAIRSGMTGALLPLALVLAAAAVLRSRRYEGAPPPTPLPPRGSFAPRQRAPGGRGLALDGERLAFWAGAAASPDTLLLVDAPFGVTLLASPRRDRVLALFSSASGTFYLGAAFDAPARRAFAPLLDRSFTVVGDDAGMDAVGPDGEPLVLAPDELASLLDALVEHSPTCLERFILTDARGAALTLDGRHLCIGDRAVDLNAPLEWKSIVFQEAFGQVIAVYQGTWIRQSSTELTLVSLLPALGPAQGTDLDLGNLDRAVLRDLRLMQASPEPPPPSEQRIAIDRLFMLQVRSALDRAPRASHQPDRAQA